MPTRLYYIDDQASTDAERYRQRLSRGGVFDCQLLPPPSWDTLAQLVSDPPDLFLIDYALNLAQPDGTKAAYQGSTLAAEIRTRLPDTPIVLITRESILSDLDSRTRRQLTQHVDIFDELILKDSLDNDLEGTRQLLASIAEGFRNLAKAGEKDWESLIAALAATEEEAEQLREAAPPLKNGEWIVTGAAKFTRHVVLEFPGILYDSLHAATQLGVSSDAFLDSDFQTLIAPAKYSGVFALHNKHWWKNRLFRIAQELAEQEGSRGAPKVAFAEAFRRRFGRKLASAECVWDHTPIADWVCYVLQSPVKVKNSLRYYPDNRPNVMDSARVSFRAIRQSNKFDERLLDSEGTRLLTEIEALPEP